VFVVIHKDMDAFVSLGYGVDFTLRKSVDPTLPKFVDAKLPITYGFFVRWVNYMY